MRFATVLIAGCLMGGGCHDNNGSGADEHGTQADAGVDGADSGGDTYRSPALCEPVAGDREVVVIPVAFDDDVPSCTVDALDSTWFTGAASIASFYGDVSNDQLAVTGRVVDTVTIAPIGGCIGTDPMQTQQLVQSLYPTVDAALGDQGISVSADATRAYILPASIKCGSRGPAATALPPQNRVLLYGDVCQDSQVSTHELGHVFGLNHSSALNSDGETRDVGDGSDVMGSGFFSPNGPHRTQLGWVPVGKVVPAFASSDTFFLAPLAGDQANAPQVLLIDHLDDPAKAYYLSYRQALGVDAELPATFSDRVSIHEFVAECVPAGTVPQPKPLLLGTVGDGETFFIDSAGTTIRQVSHDTNRAVLEIRAID